MICSIKILKNVYGGDGLGRLGDGRVVFVPGAWVGEKVKAELVEERRGYVKARLVELEEKSPERREWNGLDVPGMVYREISPEGEERIKGEQLEEFLARARIEHPAPVQIKTEKKLNYRNKATYHFSIRRLIDSSIGGKGKNREIEKSKYDILEFGYRKEGSHEIVDMKNDPLVLPQINEALPEIRKNVFALLTQGAEPVRRQTAQKETVTVRYSELSGVQWYLGKDGARGGEVMRERTCGKVFEVPLGGFYQVNPEAGEKLAQEVAAIYARHREIAPNVLDLYCGVGVFGLLCGAEKVTGIESGREAIACAKRNAGMGGWESGSQGRRNMTFYCEEVGRNMRRIGIGSGTFVIVDPPRGGLEKGVAEWLAKSRAPVIVYVSCDPATLTRDLKVLVRGYEVTQVKWINMFPRTARFETVVTLLRK